MTKVLNTKRSTLKFPIIVDHNVSIIYTLNFNSHQALVQRECGLHCFCGKLMLVMVLFHAILVLKLVLEFDVTKKKSITVNDLYWCSRLEVEWFMYEPKMANCKSGGANKMQCQVGCNDWWDKCYFPTLAITFGCLPNNLLWAFEGYFDAWIRETILYKLGVFIISDRCSCSHPCIPLLSILNKLGLWLPWPQTTKII